MDDHPDDLLDLMLLLGLGKKGLEHSEQVASVALRSLDGAGDQLGDERLLGRDRALLAILDNPDLLLERLAKENRDTA